MSLLVQQKTGQNLVHVTLGGGIELPATQRFAGAIGLIDPRVQIQRVGPNRFDVQNVAAGVRNVGVDGTEPEEADPVDQRIRLLQKAIDRYGTLIVSYREQLKTLQAENVELRRQLEQAKQPAQR